MAYDANGVPVRRGKTQYLTLDFDAIAALEELAPGPGAQGRVVSELLRAELVRREERARLRQLVLKALEESGGAGAWVGARDNKAPAWGQGHCNSL